MGFVLMRYGLDANYNEISGTPLCASVSYSKVYKKIRHIYERELEDLDTDGGECIYDYDNQVVVDFGGKYEDENGVRYIIESIEIL